jgi:hypothetical protein
MAAAAKQRVSPAESDYRNPFQHLQNIELGCVSPSNFYFENLWLYRPVKAATKWRLDISKFPQKHRIASATQSSHGSINGRI